MPRRKPFPKLSQTRARPLREAARELADELVRVHAQCGGGDVRDPSTWVRVAEHLGCRVVDFFRPGGTPGDYTPSGVHDGVGIITYNAAYSRLDQCFTLIHETGHHVLYPHEQGSLFATMVTECYDPRRYPGDLESQAQRRHLVARMAETRILGRHRQRKPGHVPERDD